MRVPTGEQLAALCMTAHYRRCEVYRRFLVALAERPERWRSAPGYGSGARAGKMKGE
jgi:hypothetical protein